MHLLMLCMCFYLHVLHWPDEPAEWADLDPNHAALAAADAAADAIKRSLTQFPRVAVPGQAVDVVHKELKSQPFVLHAEY